LGCLKLHIAGPSKKGTATHFQKGEYYLRYASGNPMEILKRTNITNAFVTKSIIIAGEQSIYGSDRLGIYNSGVNKYGSDVLIANLKNTLPKNEVVDVAEKQLIYRLANNRRYELKDLLKTRRAKASHSFYISLSSNKKLGNVRATVADIRKYEEVNIIANDNIDFTTAVSTAHQTSMYNYYAFGSPKPSIDEWYESIDVMPNNVDTFGYRWGFNGQQREDDIAGEGNHNTAKFWEYDTRLGRRWNLDPVDKPHLSKYATLANNPIVNVDKPGDDHWYFNDQGILVCVIQTTTAKDVVYKISNNNTVSNIGEFSYNNTVVAVPNTSTACMARNRIPMLVYAQSIYTSTTKGSSAGRILGDKQDKSGAIAQSTDYMNRTKVYFKEHKCNEYEYNPPNVGNLPTPNSPGLDANNVPIPSPPEPISADVKLQPKTNTNDFYFTDGKTTVVERLITTLVDENGRVVPTNSPNYQRREYYIANNQSEKDKIPGLQAQTPENTNNCSKAELPKVGN
jgi:hypothetical protein